MIHCVKRFDLSCFVRALDALAVTPLVLEMKSTDNVHRLHTFVKECSGLLLHVLLKSGRQKRT